MQVRLEVEFDDTEFSITQREPFAMATSAAGSGVAVIALGQCVGRMITTLIGGSSATLDSVLEEFNAVVARSARNPRGYSLPRADRLQSSAETGN